MESALRRVWMPNRRPHYREPEPILVSMDFPDGDYVLGDGERSSDEKSHRHRDSDDAGATASSTPPSPVQSRSPMPTNPKKPPRRPLRGGRCTPVPTSDAPTSVIASHLFVWMMLASTWGATLGVLCMGTLWMNVTSPMKHMGTPSGIVTAPTRRSLPPAVHNRVAAVAQVIPLACPAAPTLALRGDPPLAHPERVTPVPATCSRFAAAMWTLGRWWWSDRRVGDPA